MRTDSKKLKLVYLMRVFKESTDATHGLTIPEIIKKMEAYKFTPERKSLYNDILMTTTSSWPTITLTASRR